MISRTTAGKLQETLASPYSPRDFSLPAVCWRYSTVQTAGGRLRTAAGLASSAAWAAGLAGRLRPAAAADSKHPVSNSSDA